MKYCVAFFFYLAAFSIVLTLVPCTTTYAHHKKDVLGEATTASQLNFPPVTAGPGLILPDNPFFFLDQVAQSFRLAFAFSPDDKARVREKIANERLAELRIMMARDDEKGIEKALTALSREVTLASENLSTARASGKQVQPLAKQLNETIKAQRSILGSLEGQASGVLALQLRTVRQSLKEAKVEVEDTLPEDELLKELQENLEEEIEDDVHTASNSAKGLNHAIDVLTRLASQAAEKEQSARRVALLRAIENKNEALRREQERLMELETRKLERVQEEQKRASEEAKRTIKEAQEAAVRFAEAQKKARELQNLSAESHEFQIRTTTSNSGRGSSNSGSNSGKENDN